MSLVRSIGSVATVLLTTLAQSQPPDCSTLSKEYHGVCIEDYTFSNGAVLKRYQLRTYMGALYNSVVRGWFRAGRWECTGSGACDTTAGSFMNGVYVYRDRRGRVWVEDLYANGYIQRSIEYDGRSGQKRAELIYLPEAWQLSDGPKVLFKEFDDRTGLEFNRYTWVWVDGRWRTGEP